MWQESVGRISLTVDIWSNKSLRSFLAVTAHWIGHKNSKLDLRATLLGFHLLKKKHSGKNIAQTILHLLKRAGIEKKGSFHLYCKMNTYKVIDGSHHHGQCREQCSCYEGAAGTFRKRGYQVRSQGQPNWLLSSHN